jgi:DNA damage-binding protein 1
VTQSAVRLINTESRALVSEWKHPAAKNISLASCNISQVIIAVGSELFLLNILPGEVKQIRYVTIIIMSDQ